ncbi:hypothetical protein L207DRAFT_223756 [Hyaloscypha variabilis F]|uniref:Uncharacterized protein n=1 Tax=Hyaloscypha variabilis (strain UAMH 11265 / GT02V1 / F) TaxID=1149755 RepID=A0A2J6QWF5_HYAVF|nr:hypothetical protein L207DRAFT_223756 [Hyaloscypha variabilis F]
MAWCYRGSKLDFIGIISTRTGIPASVLAGRTKLRECSVAERLSWAAKKETTRPEDTAYCLFGLFSVNMPLPYGEGMKASRRLQEEIIKINNDLTIFAWEAPKPYDKTAFKLFAETPAAFVDSCKMRPFGDDCEDFSVRNKGLFVSGEVPLREVSIVLPDINHQISRYALFVGYSTKHNEAPDGGIYLRKIGPKLFVRDLTLPLAGFGDPNFDQLRVLDNMTDYYILTDPKPNISPCSFRSCALHVPHNTTFELEDAVPETLWDVTDRVFLKSKTL